VKVRSFLLALTLSCLGSILSAQQISTADRDYRALVKQAFNSYNAKYAELREVRAQRATRLGRRVYELEARGANTACSHQILTETKWLLSSTADFHRIDRRLDELQNFLDHPDLENTATQQDPNDGSWGRCYTEWFFKLDATYEHLNNDSDRARKPDFPLRLLDRVNSPDKLRGYFDGVAVSQIRKDGINRRRELNESMADLMRLILRDQPTGYPWDPRLKKVLRDIILHQLRNPATGWWGERYIFADHPEFVDDLSITFHIVRYLDGDVPDLQRIVGTALALADFNEPAGWMDDGHFTDHNNMDVAVLFGFGWQAADPAQKQVMAEQIQKMLDWCLSQSLTKDGTFTQGGDDSIEENTYFGVAFLSRIGFFDASKRFWTSREFPEAQEIRQRITGFIAEHRDSGAAGGTYYQNALRELNSDPGQIPTAKDHR
jgi:hypothetical protein